MRKGASGLSDWEVGNRWHTRVGEPKPSCWGSVLADEMWGVFDSDWGRMDGEGYAGVERLGGGE